MARDRLDSSLKQRGLRPGSMKHGELGSAAPPPPPTADRRQLNRQHGPTQRQRLSSIHCGKQGLSLNLEAGGTWLKRSHRRRPGATEIIPQQIGREILGGVRVRVHVMSAERTNDHDMSSSYSRTYSTHTHWTGLRMKRSCGNRLQNQLLQKKKTHYMTVLYDPGRPERDQSPHRHQRPRSQGRNLTPVRSRPGPTRVRGAVVSVPGVTQVTLGLNMCRLVLHWPT